ncbi:hypothetical protein CVT25_005988 [Psilocybe cyanescens]|uniref:AP complex subunit sigma n=1 Tax=Psilocybe cyanescens TaxID=93625 RepID=A0A409VMC3_PSICY|nr:hypothetical protein CVT25_005988 [Psilocybe cyanescens]
MINYVLLVSKQGKLRLAKWFVTLSSKAKSKIVQDVSQMTLARRPRTCNFLEYKGKCILAPLLSKLKATRFSGSKIVYRRYASLYFICGIDDLDNELATLEIIHRYVEILDRHFGNVCEMDLIFNFQKAYSILDELIIAGEMQESSVDVVLETVSS